LLRPSETYGIVPGEPSNSIPWRAAISASRSGSWAQPSDAARANLDAAEELAASIPHRERYLRLVHRYGRALLDVHERWLDETERELRLPGS
jgi:hypothetical protein